MPAIPAGMIRIRLSRPTGSSSQIGLSLALAVVALAFGPNVLRTPVPAPPPPLGRLVAVVGAGCQVSTSQRRGVPEPTLWRPIMKTCAAWRDPLVGNRAI